MCLDKIKKRHRLSSAKLERKWVTRYKVMWIIRRNGKTSYDSLYNDCITTGVTYTAKNITGLGYGYLTGFHVFVDIDEAREHRNSDTPSKSIIKVQCRGLLAKGIQYWSDVEVYLYMRIPKRKYRRSK